MNDMGNDEWLSLPNSEQQLQEMVLRNTHHSATKLAELATKTKRSPYRVFILLVGLTSAGKSSTVDHLFWTNTGETKHLQPEVRSTIEYTVKLKSTKYCIPDLQLSIIDPPGLYDTNDLEQDAKNIMSVKYFLESNFNIRNRYPNLVMLIHDINDNRFAGHSSSFTKMLIDIKDSKAIDFLNHNVVVVLTHAMGIARNPKIWEEKVELKKSQIRDMVRDNLNLNPEIVVLENQPENNDLKHDGDWYLLPNGDKQPEILYQACEKMFMNANDEIGLEAFTLCFRSDIDKSVKKGNTVSSSSVKMEDSQAKQIQTSKDLNSSNKLDRPPNQDEVIDVAESIDSICQEDSDQQLHPTAKSKWCSCCLCCFHEDSLVMLDNQSQKLMKNISIGDKILTTDSHGRLTQDEIIAWLHLERDGQFTFLQIVHNLGRITLSPEHIMFVGNRRHPKHASALNPGDELFFFADENNHKKETMVIVLSIHKVKGRGLYAPLTYSGRLLVDKVNVSCYSSINPLQVMGKEMISSHALAHLGFLPLRMAFNVGINITTSQLDDETGVHFYPRWLMKVTLGKFLTRIAGKECKHTN